MAIALGAEVRAMFPAGTLDGVVVRVEGEKCYVHWEDNTFKWYRSADAVRLLSSAFARSSPARPEPKSEDGAVETISLLTSDRPETAEERLEIAIAMMKERDGEWARAWKSVDDGARAAATYPPPAVDWDAFAKTMFAAQLRRPSPAKRPSPAIRAAKQPSRAKRPRDEADAPVSARRAAPASRFRVRAAATAVIFPDARLGVDLKLDEKKHRVTFVRAAVGSPAAGLLTPGVVLARVDGAPVGSVDSRDAYRALTAGIRAAPRPLTLEFVESA